MRREGKLSELPDQPLKLTAEHFRKVVRRIETIVPKADPQNGNLIKVRDAENDGGMYIGLKSKPLEVGIFNVLMCVDGQVTTIGFLCDLATIPAGSGSFTKIEVLTSEPDDTTPPV